MKNDIVHINIILDSIRKIEEFTKGFSEQDFYNDNKTQSSVILHLILIGEYSNKISDNNKSKIDLPWREIIGFRNMAVHEYTRLELDIIWRTIKNRISDLKEKIEDFLENNKQ